MKMYVKNSCSKKISVLLILLPLLLLSTCITPVSADISYPPLTPGDYHIAYDSGEITGYGRWIASDGAKIRVLYTPQANGLLHEIRIIWSFMGDYSGSCRLVIEDADTPSTKVTSDPILVMDTTPASWHVIDVLSLGFVTSGDFYVYIQYESGGIPSVTGLRNFIPILEDDDGETQVAGRFQWYDPDKDSWGDLPKDMCIRAVISPLPDQVIPELPLGTVTALLMMTAALFLHQKH